MLQEIHSMKQGEENVSDFFADLKISWEQWRP